MIYTCKYKSPLGEILLAADEIGLTGLWFEGQKYFANTLPDERISQETEILSEAKKWLDRFFYVILFLLKIISMTLFMIPCCLTVCGSVRFT